AFEKGKNEFTYAEGSPGMVADAAAAAKDIMAALQAGNTGPIDISAIAGQPQFGMDELKENSQLVGEVKTNLAGNGARKNNILLGCEQLHGYEILPGQTISLRNIMGELTTDKGYAEASTEADGENGSAVGGGVAQVYGTLYNAALLGNMEIVERYHHTFVSSYLPPGLDAKVDGDLKDLRLKNTSEHPLYVSAVIEGDELVVRLYGQPLAADSRIEIETEITGEFKPGEEDTQYTEDLPEGQRKQLQAAKTGYEVSVYRQHYLAGELVESEEVSKDVYSSQKAVVMEGTAKGGK
ncbi:VanW family protein, partial [Eubacteriales bacterium OttesenSCG-928-N14]|nr:VanW family protein [Eubacteriales bacterium OttesenSCG-928-N14]